jgi:predicted RNase H-like HicB family nuclease
MKYYTFAIVVEKEPEDTGYFAYSPTLPGCFSNGATIEDARRNMREAVQQHIESLLARPAQGARHAPLRYDVIWRDWY